MTYFEHHYINQGTGIPFVFQHGLGSNVEQSKKLLQGLEGFQLITMDCPGHGKSPLSEDQVPSFDYYADELIRLLNDLKIEKAIFGGISMGAGIATNIALRYPERVKALILIRPAWLDEPNPQNLRILNKAADWIGDSEGLANFSKNKTFQKIQTELPNAAISILGVFADSQRTEIPKVLKSMVNDVPFLNMNDLIKIQKPCIILANENDPLHPFEMSQLIQQRIKDAQLHKVISRYVDDSRHRVEVQRAVLIFLKRINEQS